MKKIILASFILYLPFQLVLPQIPMVNTTNLFFILLGFILLFGRSNKAVRTKFDLPLLLFLFIWLLSFLHTIFYPMAEMWRFTIAIEFKRLITLVLGYFVFSRCLKTKKELQFLFYVFFLSIILVSLNIWRNGMLAGEHFADFKRSSGPFGEGWRGSDIAGGFVAIFTPLLLSFALLTRKNVLRLFAIVGIAVCFLGIFATYSRGSILALAIALFATFLVAIKYLFKTSKISTLFVIFILCGLAAAWQRWIPEPIIQRVQGTFNEEAYVGESRFDQSTEGRIGIWKSGLEIFKSNPVFGVGFKIPQYLLSRDTHNTYIQILAEMGILGFLFFLWIIWGIFRQASGMLNTDFSWLGMGIIGGMTAFIFVNFFYSNFFRDTVVGTFWIALGLLASAKKFALENRTLESGVRQTI